MAAHARFFQDPVLASLTAGEFGFATFLLVRLVSGRSVRPIPAGAGSAGDGSARIARMRRLVDVVAQVVELPLSIHLAACAESEAIQAPAPAPC